jgi:hypothetical protein
MSTQMSPSTAMPYSPRPRYMRNSGACDQRLDRRAAAEEMALDDGNAHACPRQAVRQGGPGLPGTDDDRIERPHLARLGVLVAAGLVWATKGPYTAGALLGKTSVGFAFPGVGQRLSAKPVGELLHGMLPGTL